MGKVEGKCYIGTENRVTVIGETYTAAKIEILKILLKQIDNLSF